MVWPENVVDVEDLTARRVEQVRALALREQVDIVFGATTSAPPAPGDVAPRFRNLAVSVDSDGTVVDTYDKIERVPFGEYVPARRLVERVADVSPVPRDAVPGRGAPTLRTPTGTVGVLISFEVQFAELARRAVRDGAGLLVVPTNTSSYVTDDVPEQQLAAARLRAIETGRWVVIAGPTGPTGVVDREGRVVDRLPLENAGHVQTMVEQRSGTTPFVLLGEWPVLLAAGGLLVAGAGVPSRRRARSSSPTMTAS